MHKLLLYGGGKRCKRILKLLSQFEKKEVTILDSNPDKWGTKLEGCQVVSPDKVEEFQNADICITIADPNDKNEIRKRIQENIHCKSLREVHYNKLYFEALRKNEEVVQYVYKSLKINNLNNKPVLFGLYEGFILGGVEEWCKDLCKALIKDGRENIYIVSKRGEYDIPPLFKNCMLYIDEQEGFEKNSILNAIKVIAERLPCKMITTKPDSIMMAAYLIKCYYPDMIEVISTIRGSNREIYQTFEDLKDIPDLFIGVSQDIRRDFIQMGIAEDRVYSMCVPFTCDEKIIRRYTECQEDPIHIGYAGRLEYEDKRMDLLMKLILVLVEKKVPFAMEVAGDGKASREMEKFIDANSLNKKVKLLGMIERSEIPGFWKRQDICVNISDYEGRCHSIIEAMGNGAVPVVTATSGVREDIEDDINGYIVPIADYCSMADKIEYLSQHRNRLCKMGKLAHDVVYPKSRIESHLAFWNEIFAK